METTTEKKAVQELSQEELESLLNETHETDVITETEEAETNPEQADKTVTETETETETETVTREEYQRLMEENQRLTKENETLKKKTENQDKFFARQGTEIGLLRKQTPEEELEELQEIRDLYFEDPIKAREKHDQYLEKKRNMEKAAEQERFAMQVQENIQTVTQYVPDFEDHIEDLANLIKQDGASNEVVEQFKEMPYIFDPAVLVNLYRRSRALKEAATLRSEIEALKKENEELKKKPESILQKIEQAANAKVLTGKSAGVAAIGGGITLNKPVHLMSREEIKEVTGG